MIIAKLPADFLTSAPSVYEPTHDARHGPRYQIPVPNDQLPEELQSRERDFRIITANRPPLILLRIDNDHTRATWQGLLDEAAFMRLRPDELLLGRPLFVAITTWVYDSPTRGKSVTGLTIKAVQICGFYSVADAIDNARALFDQ